MILKKYLIIFCEVISPFNALNFFFARHITLFIKCNLKLLRGAINVRINIICGQ